MEGGRVTMCNSVGKIAIRQNEIDRKLEDIEMCYLSHRNFSGMISKLLSHRALCKVSQANGQVWMGGKLHEATHSHNAAWLAAANEILRCLTTWQLHRYQKSFQDMWNESTKERSSISLFLFQFPQA